MRLWMAQRPWLFLAQGNGLGLSRRRPDPGSVSTAAGGRQTGRRALRLQTEFAGEVGLLEALLHGDEKTGRVGAVDDAVVVGEG